MLLLESGGVGQVGRRQLGTVRLFFLASLETSSLGVEVTFCTEGASVNGYICTAVPKR